jgi:hypothetical protein
MTQEVGHTTRLRSAAFEDSSSQLEELGFEYEITSDEVFFTRSDAVVEEYDPDTRMDRSGRFSRAIWDSRSRFPAWIKW